MNAYNALTTAVKGFFMGAANVVPGVSGGTIALISGIFGELIEALDAIMRPSTWKSLFKDGIKAFWAAVHGNFLLALAVGVVVSVFSLAKLMEFCLSHYPIPTWAFFFGLIVASAWLMLRDIRDWKMVDAVFVLAGLTAGVMVCTLTPSQTPDTLWFVFLCGAVAICTMILPGVSGSFILVVMGKYDYVMSAVSSLDIPVLAVFAAGCAVGIVAFAKVLHWLLARFGRQTMLVLLGFVLGSLVKVWPWADKAALADAQMLRSGVPAPLDMQIPWAVALCVAGIAMIVLIDVLGRRKSA